ncbi:MAG: MarR family transcriptional regulator [Actinomycetia bacterium]|nr:MarR family transcriptional regulator [Actinomycetes bacterium]
MTRPIARRLPTDIPLQAGPKTYTHDPDPCPCLMGRCTLSRVARATANDTDSAGALRDSEREVATTLSELSVDTTAMGAVNNIYRAFAALRNHLERTVLVPHDLTWTSWVVLWVVWIWESIETRHVAEEAGISKGTLTGVATTLEKRGLISRGTHPGDGRRVLLTLTPKGKRLAKSLYPLVNAQEAAALGALSEQEAASLSTMARKIVLHVAELSIAAGATSPDDVICR